MENFRSVTTPDQPIEKPAQSRQALIDIVETLLISVILFLGINAVSARIRVDSFSMEPALYRGNFVIVNKLAYNFGPLSRGDIIVFRYPPNPSEQYIKRIIGLPGDQVQITDGKVYINGVLLEEPYIGVATTRGGDWLVPEDSLFVMGDNRNNSSDSRVWGMVPMGNIIGRATIIYWPPEKWGVLSMPYAAAAEP